MMRTKDTNRPTEATTLERAVRAVVHEHATRGNCYIKVKHIATALNQPPQRITPIVGDLVRDGTLAVWRETSGNPTVYRITR